MSSGILHRVALVRSDVSEDRIAHVRSSPIVVTPMMQAIPSSETSVLTRVRRRNIPENGILHSYRRENLKSYIVVLHGEATNRHIHIVFLRSVLRLPDTANVVPSSPILATLMIEAIHSYETSVLTRSTRRKIPEDSILHSHRSEDLKSYIALTVWAL
jgi:hypothetical protein